MKNLSKKSVLKKSSKLMPQTKLTWVLRSFFFVAAAAVMTFLLTFDLDTSPGFEQFKVGDPAPRSLFSPLEVNLIDEVATDKLRKQQMDAVYPFYEIDQNLETQLKSSRTSFFKTFEAIEALEGDAKKAALAERPYSLSDSTVEYLAETSNREEIRGQVARLEDLIQGGLLADSDKRFLENTGNVYVNLVLGAAEEKREVYSIYTLDKVNQFIEEQFTTQGLFSKNKSLKRVLLEVVPVLFEPTLKPSAELTKARQVEVGLSVIPVETTIKKNELIVQRGEVVTEGTRSRLDLIQSKLVKKEVYNRIAATGLIVLLTYFLLFVYLFEFEKETLLSSKKVLLLQVALFLTAGLSKGIATWPGSSTYLMPTALAALLLAMLLSPRLGMVAGFVMAIFAGMITGFKVDIIFATLLASLAGTFTAFRVRKRIEFFKVGLAVGLAWFLVLFAFQLFSEQTWIPALQQSSLGLANGLLVTIPICFLLLPLFESLFNLTTDITLLELSDLNHPLLKRMIVEAPGTYHHSLVVSTLSEAACEKIGANALLARVGCYFHDIGKIAKAEYFTENMRGNRRSVHEDLTPEESFNIINHHVIGGIALGKQHKLKDPILSFIPEHQGTGVVWYFYRKALDASDSSEEISPEDFRYAGPKPQSKETAVAMLADSCEAASRSLKEPTPHNLREQVRKIINDKFIDGQFDECDLTLRDMHLIQESFVQNLMAIYHTRVSYPAKPEAKDKVDLFEGIHMPKKMPASQSKRA